METTPRPNYPTKTDWAAAEVAKIQRDMQAADREPARDWRGRKRKAVVMSRLQQRAARLSRLIPEPYDDALPF